MSKRAGVTQFFGLLLSLGAVAWLHPLSANAAATATPMAMPMPVPTASMTTLERDRAIALIPDSGVATPQTGTEWSIINHRGSGFFVLMWGLTALIVGLQYPRKTWFRFVPPMFLFGLAEFLFIRSDPKAWPSGPIGYWISFRDPSAVEHRTFVLLITAIGIVELLRAADKLPKAMQIFALPTLALFGAIFLFFHRHGGLAAQTMMQNHAMANSPQMQQMNVSMKQVKGEHLWFSLCGFALVPAKLLADAGVLKGKLGATLWTWFIIALGIYMLGYTE